MAEETPPSKSRGKIVCQDGELEFDDPTVEDGFADMKAAILTGRTDIVRIILSAAQSCKFVIYCLAIILVFQVIVLENHPPLDSIRYRPCFHRIRSK